MTRARSIALALVILLGFTVGTGFTVVPIALGDSSPPVGMSGVAIDNITTELPEQTPMGQVHEDLQEHGVYTSAHADTLEILVTNPGQAKQYTDGSVWGQGPIAMVFSDDEHSDAREVALPTEVVEDIFGYHPKFARGTYEDGSTWGSEIRYENDYAVFEVPHFSDQIVTFEGEVSISADPGMADDSFSWSVDDEDSVSNLSLEMTGYRNVEDAVHKERLSSGEGYDILIEGNQDSDEVTLTITGVENTSTEVFTGGEDNKDFHVDGNADATVKNITITGDAEEITVTESGGTLDIDGTENVDVEVEFTAYESSNSIDNTYSGSEGGPDDASEHFAVSSTIYNPSVTYEIMVDEVGLEIYYGGPESLDGDVSLMDDSLSTYSDRIKGYSISGSYDNGVHTIAQNDGPYYASPNDLRDSDDGRFAFRERVDIDNGEVFATYTIVASVHSPDGVSVSLGSKTNDIGSMSDGETRTTTFEDVEPGEYSVSASASTGSASVDASEWTEFHPTENPTVSIDGGETLIDYEGTLADGEEVTETLGDVELEPGTHQLVLEEDSTTDYTFELAVDERWATEDPEIAVAGDTYNHTGVLTADESKTWTVGSDMSGTVTMDATTAYEDVVANLTIEEVTVTEDPEIVINDEHSVSYDGILADGQTVDFSGDLDESWIEEDNTLKIEQTVPDSVDGPAGQVTVDFSHTGDASRVVEHTGTVFEEDSYFEHTWVESQEDATITVEWASDRIIRLGHLHVTHNDTVINDPSYAFSGSDIIINLGDVEVGEETRVDLTGWKIAAENGDIYVSNPTDTGLDLVTTFEVTETTEEPLTLQVGGHEQGHLIHYLDEDSDAPDGWDVRTLPDGSQEVRMPDTEVGDSIRIGTTDLEIFPEYGDVVVNPTDPDTPEFQVSPGWSDGDAVEITWHGAEPGEQYELYSVSDGRTVSVEQASSPVSFSTTDQATTYLIQPYVSSGQTDEPPVAPPVEDSDVLPGPLWLWVLGAVLASIFVLAFITDRFGDDEGDRDVGVSVPVVGNVGFTMPGLARSPILVGGMVIVGIIALEALTPRTLFSPDAIPIEQIWILTAGVGLILSIWAVHTRTRIDLPDWLLYTVVALVGLGMLEFLFTDGLVSLLSVELGIALETGEVAQVLIGIGILLALWQIDTRTTDSIPIPILIAAGAITIVWVLETIQPGVILGGLSEGFATVSPLFWLIVVVGGAYFARAYIRAQRAPDTQVQLQLGEDDD